MVRHPPSPNALFTAALLIAVVGAATLLAV